MGENEVAESRPYEYVITVVRRREGSGGDSYAKSDTLLNYVTSVVNVPSLLGHLSEDGK